MYHRNSECQGSKRREESKKYCQDGQFVWEFYNIIIMAAGFIHVQLVIGRVEKKEKKSQFYILLNSL